MGGGGGGVPVGEGDSPSDDASSLCSRSVSGAGDEGGGVGGRHQHLSDPGMYFAE